MASADEQDVDASLARSVGIRHAAALAKNGKVRHAQQLLAFLRDETPQAGAILGEKVAAIRTALAASVVVSTLATTLATVTIITSAAAVFILEAIESCGSQTFGSASLRSDHVARRPSGPRAFDRIVWLADLRGREPAIGPCGSQTFWSASLRSTAVRLADLRGREPERSLSIG